MPAGLSPKVEVASGASPLTWTCRPCPLPTSSSSFPATTRITLEEASSSEPRRKSTGFSSPNPCLLPPPLPGGCRDYTGGSPSQTCDPWFKYAIIFTATSPTTQPPADHVDHCKNSELAPLSTSSGFNSFIKVSWSKPDLKMNTRNCLSPWGKRLEPHTPAPRPVKSMTSSGSVSYQWSPPTLTQLTPFFEL